MIESTSRYGGTLHLSGSTGLLATFSVLLYQVLLRDPAFLGGRQTPPDWLMLVIFTLAIGSLAVIYYSLIIESIHGQNLVIGLGILSQWGLPVAIALPRDIPSGIPFDYFIVVFTTGHVLAAFVVVVNVAFITTQHREIER